jgi:hypothetical protein
MPAITKAIRPKVLIGFISSQPASSSPTARLQHGGQSLTGAFR